MSAFPTLKSGAVAQYPAQRDSGFSTQIIRFLDGTEQRFSSSASPLFRWEIQLDLLDEDELARLAEFFEQAAGAAEDFSFTDPWTNTVYPSCSLENDSFTVQLREENVGKTSLTVRQNRS